MSQPADSGDATCMERLAAGDDLALNDLMDSWSPRVISYLTRLTGNLHTAHDLAQETFVRVYRHRHGYRSSQPFSTWLFHIATNLARNQARWHTRHPEVLTGADEDTGSEIEPDTPADAAMRKEQAHAVQQAVLDLPEDLRSVLVLSVYEAVPQVEIAEILGLSVKAVEMRIYRARQMLREKLSPHLGN
ncbi:sigma-70 family RNA polymerase sigma factor [Verrucomicrobium sp. BvORR106]|uniref:RNA polymerase sigma factor n=1 Tax=Verrucomicrobium sp. BvORR106 TaxID=1403819 RepID=UPI00068FB38B|nr:sigma-70 family RNA polymerase sigma factor [Verrucomicrobium sp. BvORR106]